MPRTFTIRKQDGRWQNVRAWNEYLNSLPDGRYIAGELRPFNRRSLPQNSWFHAVLPDILAGLQAVGYAEIRTLDQAKAFVKSLFFRVTYTNGIDVVEVIQGTSDTDKTDFSEKAEEIIYWCREYLGIDVAPPGEQTSFALAERDEEANATIIQKG